MPQFVQSRGAEMRPRGGCSSHREWRERADWGLGKGSSSVSVELAGQRPWSWSQATGVQMSGQRSQIYGLICG